jgi:hypothetical protein
MSGDLAGPCGPGDVHDHELGAVDTDPHALVDQFVRDRVDRAAD